MEEQVTDKKQDFIDQRLQDLNNDGVDRRGLAARAAARVLHDEEAFQMTTPARGVPLDAPRGGLARLRAAGRRARV